MLCLRLPCFMLLHYALVVQYQDMQLLQHQWRLLNTLETAHNRRAFPLCNAPVCLMCVPVTGLQA